MADFLCWHANSWEGIEDALANPEDGTAMIGYRDAEEAAAEFRDGDADDYERDDETVVYVQQIESPESMTYVGDPLIVDVTREIVPRYSGTVSKEVRNG